MVEHIILALVILMSLAGIGLLILAAFAIYDQSGYALLSRGEAPEHVGVMIRKIEGNMDRVDAFIRWYSQGGW